MLILFISLNCNIFLLFISSAFTLPKTIFSKKKNSAICVYYMKCGLNGYNYGDHLNEYLFQRLTNKTVKRCRLNNSKVMGFGSILNSIIKVNCSHREKNNQKMPLIIYGSGFIRPTKTFHHLCRQLIIKAIRGKNSLFNMKKLLHKQKEMKPVLGDPGLLASILIKKEMYEKILHNKRHFLCVIPHYIDKQIFQKIKNRIKIEDKYIIDIEQNVVDFILEVFSCDNILSSSLHGIITADSFGIPNRRAIFSHKIIGKNYKYDDYYSAFNLSSSLPINFTNLNTIFKEIDVEEIRMNYKIKKEMIIKKQLELLNSFPLKISKEFVSDISKYGFTLNKRNFKFIFNYKSLYNFKTFINFNAKEKYLNTNALNSKIKNISQKNKSQIKNYHILFILNKNKNKFIHIQTLTILRFLLILKMIIKIVNEIQQRIINYLNE